MNITCNIELPPDLSAEERDDLAAIIGNAVGQWYAEHAVRQQAQLDRTLREIVAMVAP